MSFDVADAGTGRVTKFDSSEAFERFTAVRTSADRVVSDCSKWLTTKWFVKAGRIIGCWQVSSYVGPTTIRERIVEDMTREKATMEEVERRQEAARIAAAAAAAAAAPPPRNASSKIDLSFRPASYWDHPGHKRANIKGTVRRRLVAEDEVLGDSDLEPELIADSISESSKRALQGIHPSLRGGEDLPDAARGEIEIARLSYTCTVHCEVTSIRARRSGGRIHYRVVDEYETAITCGREWSDHPLTLGELIDLIEGSSDGEWREGLYFGDLQWRVWNEDDTKAEDLEDFIEVSSSFYPEITKWFREAFIEWRDEQIAVRCDEDETDDDSL